MTRSDVATIAAVARESANPTLPAEPGWCLRYCRLMAEIPPRYLTAYLSAIHADPKPGPPPLGSFVYWRNPPDSQGTAGHIAIADGAGNCYTTDLVRTGRFDLVPIGAIHAGWGLEYLGWSYTCNDVEIPHADHGAGGGEPLPPPEPPAPIEEDDVSKLVRDAEHGGTVYALSLDTVRHITDPVTLGILEKFLAPDAPAPISNAAIQRACEAAAVSGRLRPCKCGNPACEVAALNNYIAANNPW